MTASAGAFAALRRDGAVVTWGQATCGGTGLRRSRAVGVKGKVPSNKS